MIFLRSFENVGPILVMNQVVQNDELQMLTRQLKLAAVI